jgi:two-component system, chemotaxis family, protein-glutamate methylesterase/glutaminase
MTRSAEVFHLKVGQVVVAEDPAIISTVLGSCISVCMYLPGYNIGGAIHYALPAIRNDQDLIKDALRFGDQAIAILIDELEAASGCARSSFKAKIVGGADIAAHSSSISVGPDNIKIARRILQQNNIEVIAQDVGGKAGRKMLFHTDTGRLQVALLNEQLPTKKAVAVAPLTKATPLPPGPPKKIKVLIVDDSKTIRSMLSRILQEHQGFEVIGAAGDSYEAETMIKALRPDVMTLDINMPGRDGVSFLSELMLKNPIPTIMVSALTLQDGNQVMQALELGAVDYIQKPALSDISNFSETICEKIKVAAMAKLQKPKSSSKFRRQPSINHGVVLNPKMVLAIGASTGGTEALKEVLMGLSQPCPPVVIVQHIPPVFSKAFADRMNTLCELQVKEAEDGDVLEPNQVYIAPGGKQMKIIPKGSKYSIVINDDPPMNRHKPSVDYLFHSIAEEVGKHSLGVILTGMGTDGARGLKQMKSLGARTMAQDEASCVVYGMPKAAFETGAVDEVHALDKISEVLIGWYQKKSTSKAG